MIDSPAQIVSLLGAVINMASISFYVVGTYRGRLKPNLVSWFMWMLAPFIGTAAVLSQDYFWGALPVFIAGFGPLLVIMAALISRHGLWRPRASDWVCGGLSALALLFWSLTKDANFAILFSILSDAAAAIPTLRKSWTHPETESPSGYLGGMIGSTAGLFALTTWNFTESAFPLYLVFLNLILVGSILIGRARKKTLAPKLS